MRVRLAAALVVSGLALVTVGCGGSDEETDPTAAWAAGLCTAVTTWTDAIQAASTDLTSNPSQDGFEAAAEDVRSSTEEFVDDVRGLGSPETDSGDEIETALETASTTVEAEAEKITETVDGISGITELPGAVTAVTTSLSAMGTALTSALQAIEAADVGGELQSALEDSPECAGITTG